MNSLDKALQNIQTWHVAANAAHIKQSYKLWRENGVWHSCITEEYSNLLRTKPQTALNDLSLKHFNGYIGFEIERKEN